MRFEAFSDEREWRWFKERTHTIRCEDAQGLVVYDDQNQIQAMCVADSFTGNSCNVHFAIENPMVLRHGFFEEVAEHTFHRNSCKQIFGLVPSNNAKALKLDKHIGFSEIARIPDAIADGVDTVVMRLKKADCRWLREELREAC